MVGSCGIFAPNAVPHVGVWSGIEDPPSVLKITVHVVGAGAVTVTVTVWT